MNSYTVYKHTSPSGKVYIGITSMTPEKRWQNGRGYRNNPHFAAAILHHGWDNFRHEIVAEGLTQEAAEQVEVELIAEYDATNKSRGYNLDLGGNVGAKHSPETRQKIGAANRRRAWTGEARARIGAASKGRIPSAEVRQKMSHAHLGHTHSEEAKAKIRAAKQKPVVCIDTGRRYGSVKEAAADIGASASLVAGVCRGVYQTTHGLRFQFIQEEVVV